MRSFLVVGKAAALTTALLLGNASMSAAQTNDDASELNKKVIEFYNAGRYADAVPIAQRALAAREKVLGRDHPDVATVLNNLAGLYQRKTPSGRIAKTRHSMPTCVIRQACQAKLWPLSDHWCRSPQ